MIVKTKPQLIHQKRLGHAAPSGLFLLIFFILPIALYAIAIIVGIPLFIYFIYLLATKKRQKSLPKINGLTTPIETSAKPIPAASLEASPRVKIRPPRTSQIILLIVMVTLILGCIGYLLTH